MIVEVGDVLVSTEIFTEQFCCDLSQCKGECCVEGDAGAPVTQEEVMHIEDALDTVWGDLSAQAQSIIDKQGVAYVDEEGDLVTSIVNGKDCVFTCYGEDGCCYCAIEKAYRAGLCKFKKPVSCHLYPIREKKLGDMTGLNYDRWDVCHAAVLRGEKDGIPLYKYLKEPLIRRFGQQWYDELDFTVEELKRQGIL